MTASTIHLHLVGRQKARKRNKPGGSEASTSYSGSTSSKYSLEYFNAVVVLRNVDNDVVEGTQLTYHTIWKGFLLFLTEFDQLPENWEDKLVLYAAFLGDTQHKLATISAYISAIKYKLIHDGYTLNEDKAKLASIVRTSKLKNQQVHNRMKITRAILKDLMDAVELKYCNQPYLCALYKCMFTFAYFGLFRIGEIAKGTHTLLAADGHAFNNRKWVIQLVLRSSKMHNRGDRPQIVRIPNKVDKKEVYGLASTKYCPYTILQNYLKVRGNYAHDEEQFFIFRSGIAVKSDHFRKVLKNIISLAGYQNNFYSTHSFRAGRADDLRMDGVEIRTIQKIGRWKSEGSLARYFQ